MVLFIQNSIDSALHLSSGASSDGLPTEISTPEGDQFASVGPTTWTVILGNVCQAHALIALRR